VRRSPARPQAAGINVFSSARDPLINNRRQLRQLILIPLAAPSLAVRKMQFLAPTCAALSRPTAGRGGVLPVAGVAGAVLEGVAGTVEARLASLAARALGAGPPDTPPGKAITAAWAT
jgi:hypothetical protein